MRKNCYPLADGVAYPFKEGVCIPTLKGYVFLGL